MTNYAKGRERRERYRAAGLCVSCGLPRNKASKAYCDHHLDYLRGRYISTGFAAGRGAKKMVRGLLMEHTPRVAKVKPVSKRQREALRIERMFALIERHK